MIMKKTILFLSIILAVITGLYSCDRNEPQPQQNSLTGRWIVFNLPVIFDITENEITEIITSPTIYSVPLKSHYQYISTDCILVEHNININVNNYTTQNKVIFHTPDSITIMGYYMNATTAVSNNYLDVTLVRYVQPSGNEQGIMGAYEGDFNITYSNFSRNSKVSLNIGNGVFHCYGEPYIYGARGSGTFFMGDDFICFEDTNGWYANFDWNIIMNGWYDMTFDGTNLKLSANKNDVGLYEYNLKRVGTKLFETNIPLNTTYADTDFTLKFNAVLNDSRCPRNANCVWEGDADVQFKLNKNNIENVFSLHTNGHSDTIINDLKIKLLNLSPIPTHTEQGIIYESTLTAQVLITKTFE
jgi:hypothetical protein